MHLTNILRQFTICKWWKLRLWNKSFLVHITVMRNSINLNRSFMTVILCSPAQWWETWTEILRSYCYLASQVKDECKFDYVYKSCFNASQLLQSCCVLRMLSVVSCNDFMWILKKLDLLTMVGNQQQNIYYKWLWMIWRQKKVIQT